MLVSVLAVLSLLASHQETPKWARPGDVGYQRFSSANGFFYLEIELTSDRPLSQTSGAEFRLVMQRRATPRRTPRGARAANPLPLVEGDVLLAEGSLRRPPLAVVILDSGQGFAVLEAPYDFTPWGPANAGSPRPLPGDAPENPHFLRTYDGAGALRFEFAPSDLFSAQDLTLLSTERHGSGPPGLQQMVAQYRDVPDQVGLWNYGSLYVMARGPRGEWVTSTINWRGGERSKPGHDGLPQINRYHAGSGELALERLIDSDRYSSTALERILENPKASLDLRLRAADHLGRHHNRRGRELLLEVAATPAYDQGRAYSVGVAAQALGWVLDRSEADRVIQLLRRTPYPKEPFFQALLDMQEAGARALALAFAGETDSFERSALRNWFHVFLSELHHGDAQLVAALGQLAIAEHTRHRLGRMIWVRMGELSGPHGIEAQATIIRAADLRVLNFLGRGTPHTRLILSAIFDRLEAAVADGEEEVVELLLQRLPDLSDARAARPAGQTVSESLAQWEAYWHRAQDRPQRVELLGLAREAERRGEMTPELRAALEACSTSADPAGPILAENTRRRLGAIGD